MDLTDEPARVVMEDDEVRGWVFVFPWGLCLALSSD